MLTRRSFIVTLSAAALLTACVRAPTTPQATPSSPSAAPLRLSGSGAALPAVQKLGEGYGAIAPGIRLEYLGGTNSGGAIRGVIESKLDIAVTNRPLSEAEAREPILSFPFVRDAVTFAVHRSVSMRSLRGAEIREIYSGTLTTWRDFGGADAPIIVLDRDEDEAARKLALLPLLAGRPVVGGTAVLTSASDMLTAIDTTPQAIGYSSLGLLGLRAPKNVVPVALDDIAPSAESVESGAYPWSLTFSLVIRSDAPPATRAFVDHALASARGVLRSYEYAPV